jgi:hypothetical protein
MRLRSRIMPLEGGDRRLVVNERIDHADLHLLVTTNSQLRRPIRLASLVLLGGFPDLVW